MRNGHWRDCQAWKDEDLPIGTSSNEAAKLYDACLSQYIGWYDDIESGGLEKSCEMMHKADPNFILGLSFNLGLKLLGTTDSIRANSDLKHEHDSLQEIFAKQKNSLSPRESKHVQATLAWAGGHPSKAARIWQDILAEHPTDLHALKMSHDTFFFLGDLPQLRDSVARVLPVWETKRPPLKSYLYGLYAFGLEENNQFQKAEHYARRGLEENRFDGWSTHSLAHIFEMGGRTTEGIKFMNQTIQDWERCNHLACHNYWHVALYHLENEDYVSALEILDKHILSRAFNTKSMFDIVDCSSLLWRINLLNDSSLNTKSYCERANELCKPYSNSHITTFNDAHFMMTYAGSRNDDSIAELLETYNSVSKEGGDLIDHSETGIPILKSFAEFRKGKFEKVVELLEPIRYRLSPIGGSNAQRDVFNLMLIVAALKSSNPSHRKLGIALIHEREALKGETKLSQRLGVMMAS